MRQRVTLPPDTAATICPDEASTNFTVANALSVIPLLTDI